MLKNKNIICIGSTSWETNFLQPIVQLTSLLAINNKVLFVDYAYTWADVLRAIFKKSNLNIQNILGLRSRIRKITSEYNTELYVLSLPPIFPINWISNTAIFDFFNSINYKIIMRAVLKAQNKLALGEPYFINSWNPIFGINYQNELKQKLQVYFCYDEISASKWIAKHGSRLEKKYLSQPNLVVTTSASLAKAKSKYNPNCFVVPNGVNFKLFNSYLSKSANETFIDKGNFKNVVGYIGTIDDRTNLELMKYAITELNDHLFVFIGRITDEETKKTLSKFDNLKFIDARPSSDLPKFVFEFTVCIIPFIKNEFTVNVYPMKINEYLAMGKPVVLTDFNDLPEFAPVCSIVSSKEEFVDAIRKEITTDSTEKISRRIQMASQNSWEKRAESFSEIMNDYNK